MSVATSPLQELAEAADAARSFRLEAEFDLPGGKALTVMVYLGAQAHRHMNVIEAAPDHVRYQPVAPFADAAAALRQVAAGYPAAVLRPDTVKVSVTKGATTGAKLRPVAIRAWHEAFGRPVPTDEELAAARKAVKAATATAAAGLVALLKGGPAGVAEFNKLPARDRVGADLRNADLAGCDLRGAHLEGARLAGADLSGATLVGGRLYHGAKSADLSGAKLVGADLAGIWMPGCKCPDADFSSAKLVGTNLRVAPFRRAKFVGADLSGADLTLADLRGADLTAAVLGATLDRAKFDEHTRWPAGFRPPAGLVWKGTGPDPRLAPTLVDGSPLPSPADFPGFLARLRAATDAGKLAKALAMLKADRFRLFATVAADHLAGVVKSQSDPDLVYSCRLGADGSYACCTQNLNICGGLKGSPCKHLLVLVVGLAKAGELDPGTAHAWAQAARGRKPALDKDAMAETFLRYKGAEAGEVDWRPTETVPEDFYAV